MRKDMEIAVVIEKSPIKEKLKGRAELITWLSLALALGWAKGTRSPC